MVTDQSLLEPEYEPVEETEDAHEHGLVFRQVEDAAPLRAEDADDEDDEDDATA
jgi:hypothetical protein